MDFASAMEIARQKISASEKHLKQVRIAITRFNKGLGYMEYSYINISDVKIWHIKNTLDHLNLTPSYYNKFRQYLSDIFKLLIEYGCIDHNPVRDISKRKIEKKIREVITDEQLKYIVPYLLMLFYIVFIIVGIDIWEFSIPFVLFYFLCYFHSN